MDSYGGPSGGHSILGPIARAKKNVLRQKKVGDEFVPTFINFLV